MGSIGSSLAALNDTVGALAKQMDQNQANNVQQFTAYVQAKPAEKIADAQYIENLRPNQDRLNLFTSMPRGDNQDFYQFKLNFSGSVHFSMLADLLDDNGDVLQKETAKGLDVQIMQMHGQSAQVIADSDPTAGANYTNFKAIESTDGLNMTAGKYDIKVNRDASADSNANYFYSFQLAGDRYYQDFNTIQSAAPHTHGESVLSFLQPDAVTGLLAGSVDSTSAIAGQASLPVNGASLTAGMNDGSDPTTKLLAAFA